MDIKKEPNDELLSSSNSPADENDGENHQISMDKIWNEEYTIEIKYEPVVKQERVDDQDHRETIKIQSSIQENVKKERSPSPITLAADISLHIFDNNVKKDEFKRELVAVILLEKKTFHKQNFACGFCFGIFKSERLLKNHKLIHHEKKNTQVSKECNNSLIDENNVQHLGQKPFNCDQCSFQTANIYTLNRHKFTHSGKKPFSCDQCSFKTARLSNLNDHKMTHLGVKPFKCDQCSFRAPNMSKLKKHNNIHSGLKPYKCNECNFKTAHLSSIKAHKISHSGKKPFKCDQCSYKTILVAHLKQHKLKHSGEKPYKCDECSFRTAYLYYLKEHKVTHSGLKPHKCDQCCFKTSKLYYLKRHRVTTQH